MGKGPPASQQGRQDEKTDPELTLKRIECFHPGEPVKATTISAGTSKPRRTCNAAVALTFLKLHNLLRVPDKLAILANMCGYHVRFNTIELEKTQDSLSACVIALSAKPTPRDKSPSLNVDLESKLTATTNSQSLVP